MPLPDGYPSSVRAPYGQPASVRNLRDGFEECLDRFSGWCACGRGERLNYGTTVIKRGRFLYLLGCDPKPDTYRCYCGSVVGSSPILCDRCFVVHQKLLYAWWRPVEKEIPRGFGVTKDEMPVQAPHLAMRDHLRRGARQ